MCILWVWIRRDVPASQTLTVPGCGLGIGKGCCVHRCCLAEAPGDPGLEGALHPAARTPSVPNCGSYQCGYYLSNVKKTERLELGAIGRTCNHRPR